MYEDKFIAFVDILGFSDLVAHSEEAKKDSPSLESLLDLLKKLGSSEDSARFSKSGPLACPCAPHVSKDLAFRITQISDCVVVSSEVSPAGVINLLHHCFGISINLLMVGHLCRGFITRGQIFHTDRQFIGTGYMKAFHGEKKVSIFQVNGENTPFIQIDPSVCGYIAEQSDGCVKTLFERMTESDGGETAISPFRALKRLPSSVIRSDFDPAKQKAKVQVTRAHMQRLVAQLDKAEMGAPDEKARIKIVHYKRKLAEVLAVKDKDDELLDKLAGQFPRA